MTRAELRITSAGLAVIDATDKAIAAPEESGSGLSSAGEAITSRKLTWRPGTVLGREWNGRVHRVAVLADGFAWNSQVYPSLSKVALAITGTRWNGPKFFGLHDRPSKRSTV